LTSRVLKAADVVGGGAVTRPVHLDDVAAGVPLGEPERLIGVLELPRLADRQAEVGENGLGVGAVVLQPVAPGAAADDVEAVAAQPVLEIAPILGDVLEQDDAVGTRLAHPVEFIAPIGRALHHSGERAVAKRLGNPDLDGVAVRDEPDVERGKVACVADAEKTHESPLAAARPPASRGASLVL
jgi:hypothetical protein